MPHVFFCRIVSKDTSSSCVKVRVPSGQSTLTQRHHIVLILLQQCPFWPFLPKSIWIKNRFNVTGDNEARCQAHVNEIYFVCYWSLFSCAIVYWPNLMTCEKFKHGDTRILPFVVIKNKLVSFGILNLRVFLPSQTLYLSIEFIIIWLASARCFSSKSF